jgi:hypothetical protein
VARLNVPVTVAITFAARALLEPMLGDQAPYLFFVPAVLITAGAAGLGPGLLATGLSLCPPIRLPFVSVTMRLTCSISSSSRPPREDGHDPGDHGD